MSLHRRSSHVERTLANEGFVAAKAAPEVIEKKRTRRRTERSLLLAGEQQIADFLS